MQDVAPIGLRDRKKAATRLAIERAAVQIASNQGYEAATAEAIAAEAGVSLRTFFNYFPSKDVAIAGEGAVLIPGDRARRILEESGADLLKGVAWLVEECVARADPGSELVRRRRRLIQKNPPLLHRHIMALDRFDEQLTDVVAGHLRAHPSRRRLSGRVGVEEEARLAVIVVSGAVRYHVQHVIENDVDTPLTALEIERIVDMMSQVQRTDP